MWKERRGVCVWMRRRGRKEELSNEEVKCKSVCEPQLGK